MRGLVFDGPGAITVRDGLPEPRVEVATDVVVEVEASGLCGSDLHPYEGRERARTGVVAGHEAVGRVVAAGPDVRTVAVGERVLVPFTTSCGACGPCMHGLSARCELGRLFGWGDPDDLEVPALHGAQAELVRVPLADGTVVAVDDDLDAATAVLLTDNLPTAWAAVARAGVAPGSSLLVVGLGSVGSAAVALARALDAGPIVAVDPVASRREVASHLGADVVVAPDDLDRALAELSQRRGPDAGGPHVDAAIEASGADPGQAAAVAALRPGGVLSLIAVQTSPIFTFSPVDAYDRNLTVRAGRAPVRSLLPALLLRVRSGELVVPTDRLVTHPDRPLAEGPDLYRRFADREPGLVKATLRP